MKERPILFSDTMVRALLAGHKTQTRRAVKLDIPADAHEVFFWSGEELRRQGWRNVSEPGLWARRNGRDGYIQHVGRCPYGVPSDRLWVKETHAIVPRSAYATSEGVQQILRPDCTHDAAVYAAGWDRSGPGRWRPSIHMPRWASRLTLEITDVRVERLQDISGADAEAEGVREPSLPPIHMVSPEACGEIDRAKADPRLLWRFLWTGINGADSWDANPWVWVVSFEVRP